MQPIKHCLCPEQALPGHCLFSKLDAVHLMTVAEEYISASHFLVTMPASPVYLSRGLSQKAELLEWILHQPGAFTEWTSSALTHLSPDAPGHS